MFEVAELGHQLKKKAYNAALPTLRTELLAVQEQLKQSPFPVLVLISGVDGAGKGHTVNLLNSWFDPRGLRTFAFGPISDEERERPEFWRFWKALPARGHIGLYIGSWYSHPIAQRMSGEFNDAELDGHLLRIKTFERELIDDGALIIKVWLHLGKSAQKQRLKKLESNPETAWRVTKQDKHHLRHYDRFREIAERTLRETSTGDAPWLIVDGSDECYRSLTVGRYILEQITRHLERRARENGTPPYPAVPEAGATPSNSLTLLDHLDLKQRIGKKRYQEELEQWQGRLNRLYRAVREKRICSVVVLEGWDAAGKGGVIRRIIPALDARHYQVISVAAPSDEERAHHYLWRFWRHIPRAGHITLYDRSWYGRVLVERVEGFASHDEWMRAYAEINDFEEQLTDHGTVLLKLWLHIDKAEQLRRFTEREKVSYKQYKITAEDYRNRKHWEAYEQAVNEMVARTSTEYAPWELIEANDKRFARIKALRLYCERLERALD